jgi:uncharacterized BrkB/YihY/UPF0761 family membrane protein
MTPQEHNKYVGLAQLGYAGVQLLMMILLMAAEGYMFEDIYSRSQEMGGPPPPPFLVLIFVFVAIFTVAMTIPSVVAGYALLKRRPWAKVAGIVGGVVAATSFPIGTAVAVYTFWFLFSEVGKQVYGVKKKEPPPLPPSEWQPSGSESAHDERVSYTPPPNQR